MMVTLTALNHTVNLFGMKSILSFCQIEELPSNFDIPFAERPGKYKNDVQVSPDIVVLDILKLFSLYVCQLRETLRPSGRTRLLVYYAIPSSPLYSYLKHFITLKCLDIFCRGCGHNLVDSLRIFFNILDRMLSAYPFILWWRME